MRILTIALAVAALLATPAVAARGELTNDEFNPWYRDYQTDLSEARRELRKDLADADSRQDRERAHAEYRREVFDARQDYQKEMSERGYRTGTVTVED